ncbi:trypsin-like serine protease [Bdellovibrio sp. SKB1291214]|uniref:S1 family peptidase n=1 Tax=Bdellovibrio sp. SKB1291214 TaxID=1732569 RepID=UPI000B51CE13|nr:trypsin-like serine protease [Bdellovibrio sp. SKB1291214]UYL08679.1 trypsin-like serine protease [Bdellovibrio sp. SKB1291214]
MNKYIYALALVLLSACQPVNHASDSDVDDVTEEIVGGTKVTRMDSISKHLAFIYSDRDYSYCTGTIISDNMILTAAHCIKNSSETLSIGFGLDYIEGNMQVRYSSGSVAHSGFKFDSTYERNDIAILFFSGGLPEGFEPVPLANASVFAKADANIVTVGYGRVKGIRNLSANENGYGRLRKVNLKIQSVSSNKKTFEVSQKDGRGICYGDSGGPAFIKSKGLYYLAGVTSAVLWYKPKESIYDLCKEHSIFMDVKFYSPWIKKHSRK